LSVVFRKQFVEHASDSLMEAAKVLGNVLRVWGLSAMT
jgi:hypothetical protein